ncbi:ATP-binding protein [Serratia sp. M24T3]|uniref:ATP-binding protein n=1 Tax=Serratia sp. M24T3 TaxID=932213 RepID=UPI00025BBED9|nr:ATP-binding protein [Serratia sp. M24T3]EIC83317.1 hypothetical protein SPM24T3_17605 [Serratia sp. M24T3]
MHSKLPPLISVIGSDGSGKSTVCEHLITCVEKYGPAEMVHLGKQAGNVERVVVKFPFMGRFLKKSIANNKVKVDKAAPGPLAASVIMIFVIRRLLRFRRMLALRQQGNIILSDRFPQVEIPSAFDGPTIPEKIKGNRFVQWIAQREWKAFEWMTQQKPDLVIKLNVDLDVACARKPDHSRNSLAKKIAVVPLLNFVGSEVVNIDANLPLAEVISTAELAVSKFMEAHGYSYVGEGHTVAAP